jgi:hypothetical protein
MQIPQEIPKDTYDLVLFSEVGCYLTLEDLRETRCRMLDVLKPGGYLLMVHYRQKVESFHLGGDTVHDYFIRECHPGMVHLGDPRQKRGKGLDIIYRYYKCYRMDLFQRARASV